MKHCALLFGQFHPAKCSPNTGNWALPESFEPEVEWPAQFKIINACVIKLMWLFINYIADFGGFVRYLICQSCVTYFTLHCHATMYLQDANDIYIYIYSANPVKL